MVKRIQRDGEARGKLVFGGDGKPLCYSPVKGKGVSHRVRSLADVRRLHSAGDISDEDFTRAESAWADKQAEK